MTTWKSAEHAERQQGAVPVDQDGDTSQHLSSPRRSATEFYRAFPVHDRRIHIIGVGNVGSFIAHALRGIVNPPPVTLIFTQYLRLNQWNESPQRLTLITEDDVETRKGYDVEVALPRRRFHGKEVGPDTPGPTSKGLSRAAFNNTGGPQNEESSEPIRSLIVCSKAHGVLQGLSAVKHRLNRDSVILFMQNGVGIIEEINKELFPDVDTRPYYMLGINSHGLHRSPNGLFSTVHAGFGTIALGILPHERDRDATTPLVPGTKFRPGETAPFNHVSTDSSSSENAPPSSASFYWTSNQRYLLRTLLRTPVLSAVGYSPSDLLQLQLDKLAVNCIVNPLTVMLDARNGAILNNYALTRTMRLLLSEISLVIRSLPELKYVPNVEQRFDPGRLETTVVAVAYKTRNNVSSMLADIRSGRPTEIDYINGWIVKRGEEIGLKCLMNYMLIQMVKGKRQVVQLELQEGVPIVEDNIENAADSVVVRSARAGSSLSSSIDVKQDPTMSEQPDALEQSYGNNAEQDRTE